MHLCIPDYEKKKKEDGLILPSGLSYNARTIVLNEISDWNCAYHFPVYDINHELSNVVIIRNLPSMFSLNYSDEGHELKSMIKNVCQIDLVNLSHGVLRVTVDNSKDASRVAEWLDGWEIQGRHLTFIQGNLEEDDWSSDEGSSSPTHGWIDRVMTI